MSRDRIRVVITGMGAVTPLGRTSIETFEKAVRGESGIGAIASFDTSGLPCRIGGEVPDDWIGISGNQRWQRFDKYASRGFRLMRIAAAEAADQADLGRVKDRERIGTALGTYGEMPSAETIVPLHAFYRGEGAWDVKGIAEEGRYDCLAFMRRKPDIQSSLLSILFDCRGSSFPVTTACSAGAQAVGEAYLSIQDQKYDVMLAGGCDSPMNLVSFMGFLLLKALPEKYAAPEKASRPFDRKRNGFVLSEGAGAVVLEELNHARKRGAPILGEILGYGSSADAYRITDTRPDGEGGALAMAGALADAGLGPDEVDYINAHGTSTKVNDRAEALAIHAVFGDRARDIPVSSNKSMLGHTIGAAGAIELVLTLMGMRRSLILPTVNYEYRDPKCDLNVVPDNPVQKKHRVALSNSFGFGGQNVSLCIGPGPDS
jgi:3-oxoacyl-[acyl-carrier-protein] synthase II